MGVKEAKYMNDDGLDIESKVSYQGLYSNSWNRLHINFFICDKLTTTRVIMIVTIMK